MNKLTALFVRNLKEPGRYADGGGLSYEITKAGAKRWLYRYRLGSKQQNFVVGRYPELSLEKARKAHKEAKELVSQGINPSVKRKTEIQENINELKVEDDNWKTTFKSVAFTWIDRQRKVWSHDHATAVLNSLKKDVFEPLGAKQIDAITPREIIDVVQSIEERGSMEMAKKALQRTSAVFRYAVQFGFSTYNPASELKGILQPKKTNHMPAVYRNDLGELVRNC